MPDAKRLLDPAVLNKITRLDLKARLMVEVFVSGMHKSPYHGFSVEFAEHRQYTPGDDLRHLDWKIFGRTDRLYIKEYELETNLRSHILLDTSESMDYGSEGRQKLETAAFIAASLGYLIVRQQDAVGLATFDKSIQAFIPTGSHLGHLRQILTVLGMAKPQRTSDLGQVLHVLAERIPRRGLILLVSDLFDDADKILKGLQHLRHTKHDVIVFHVLDADETTFPFDRMTLFEGMEEFPKVLCDPKAVRAAYLQELDSFCAKIRKGCVEQKIDYCRITTDQKLDVALSAYLAERLKTRTY